MIANQSATFHGNIHRTKAFAVANSTNIANTVIAQKTRVSVIVATISLPFAARAAAQPTNIEATTCAKAIPSVAKNM